MPVTGPRITCRQGRDAIDHKPAEFGSESSGLVSGVAPQIRGKSGMLIGLEP